MKNRYLTLVAVTLAATTSLAACAPSAEPEPSAPAAAPATSEAPSEPTPEPTPERIEFSGATIAFADLVEAEAEDNAVILLPRVLDASVTIEGVDAEKWFVEPKTASGLGGVDVTESSPGTLTVKPIAGYDAFKDPKDFVQSADGALIFETSEGTFKVEVEGVEP